MEIEFTSTPPKKKVHFQDCPSTPPNKTSPINCFETPKKKSSIKKIEQSPQLLYSTPPQGENPQSKKEKTKNKNQGSWIKHSNSSHKKKISEFNLSRLDQDYSFVKTLGEGNFSSVGLYASHMTGQYFAIKTTKLSNMSINEAQALGTLSIFSQKSKNIVRYYYSWVENNELYLVMEHCSHTLTKVYREHKNSHQQMKQSELKDILRQSLQGLKCMHQYGMVHLDLKPDNLLFSHKSIENRQSVIKISDLGLTRITKIKRQSDLEEGDSRYLAKQLLNYESGIDLTKSDIFSLGMTIYEGLTLTDLPNNGEEWQNIRQYGLSLTSRMDLTDYSRDLLQIIEMMTSSQHSLRPSAEQLLKMRYFKQSFSKRPKILEHNIKQKKQQRKKDSSI